MSQSETMFYIGTGGEIVAEDQFTVLMQAINKLSEQAQETRQDILDRMDKKFKELPCNVNVERLKGVENGLASIKEQREMKLAESARNLTRTKVIFGIAGFALGLLTVLWAVFRYLYK